MTSPATDTESRVEHAAHPHRWLMLAVLALAQLMVILDGTIVNIALPQAQESLGMSDNARTWVVTVYALAFGGLLLFGGRIVDYWGRKRSFIVGLLGFAASSALGGLAVTTEMLLVARGMQGAFAALLAPASLAVLTLTFPGGKDRVRAFAVYGAIGGSGAAAGLLLGGVLTEYASWNWCLLVNVPIALVALAAAIPLVRESRAEGDSRYDVPGAVLIVAGLSSLIYGFSQAEEGWDRIETLGFLGLGVLLIAAFVWVESAVRNPLLPLRVVLDRVRGGAFLVSTLLGASMLGAMLFLSFHLQIVLGFTPLLSGIAVLPMPLAITIGAFVLSQVLDRIGVRTAMTIGPVLAAAGLYLLTFITVDGNYYTEVLPGLIVFGLGVACVFVPLQNVALYGVLERDAGVASATITATQQIGGSIGTALFTALYTGVVTDWEDALTGPPSQTEVFQAFVDGYALAFGWGAAIVLLAAPIAFFLIRPSKDLLSRTVEVASLG